MNILTIVLLAFLVVGFAAMWTPRWGRQLFDIAVFLILLFFLIGTQLSQ
jgi:hypothetical protein